MIKTSIIIGVENNFPICFPQEGLAVTLKMALWLFAFCGWQQKGAAYPDLAYQVGEDTWKEGEIFFTYNPTHLYVLGSKLHLN